MLEDAPPVISVLGDPALLAARAVGLVGARNASANGQRMAEALAAELASHGVLVVSGLARGIDTAAHTGALHTGHTAAAIAGGLDMPYPAENTALQARIAERGVVIAEAPLGTAPQARHFPRRNRIIAGLSIGVVVVEAARHSGSLITAQQALDAHRMVLAVPGSPLDPALARLQRPDPQRRHPGRPGVRRAGGDRRLGGPRRRTCRSGSPNRPPRSRPRLTRRGRAPKCSPCSATTRRRLTI